MKIFPNKSFSFIAFLFFPILIQANTNDLLTPEFSRVSGFYSEPFELSINIKDADATIYYTIDGSEPTPSSHEYKGPVTMDSRDGEPNVFSEIPTNYLGDGHPYRENWVPPQGEVNKINIIRARAYAADGTEGPVVSGSYIIDPEAEGRYTMPVVSIMSDRDSFFDDDTGIYVTGNASGGNFHQRGREWERPVYMELFEEDGTRKLGQDAGVRIHGGTSRNRPRKSLRLYARSDYSKTWFNYPIFEDKPVPRYKRFLLRNSGNDWSESLFRDAYLQQLIQNNTDLDVQHSRPAIAFLNGEYWGIHNLRDRYDGRYLESHYGVDPDRIIIMENYMEYDKGNEAYADDYRQLHEFIVDNPMSDAGHYEKAGRLMDIDNFIDFQILHIFTRNTDWPGNNNRYWKYVDGTTEVDMPVAQDGRWRWMAFDLDFGFGQQFDYVKNSANQYGNNNPCHDTIAFALEDDGPDWPNPPWSTAIFRNLMDNDRFRNKFINRFTDHLNTSFHVGRAEAVLDSMKAVYEPEMQEHIERWTEPGIQYWENDIGIMRNFASSRADILFNHLNNHFDLGGRQEVTLDINNSDGGLIRINSMKLQSNRDGIVTPAYPWTGTYFRDEPVTLIALPEAGYQFDGWTGDVEAYGDTLTVEPGEIESVYANFSETGHFEQDEMTPEPYNLRAGAYIFDYWDPQEPEGRFPDHMVFRQSSVNDPTLTTEMTHPYFIPYVHPFNNDYHDDDQDKIGKPYSLTGRSRINGLGSDGISVINTGRGRDLGDVVLALDTRPAEQVSIHWKAATKDANSRKYNIRMQYRNGLHQKWKNVTDSNGEIVEYQRQETGHEQYFEDIPLPGDAYNRPYIQLRWNYYYTGERVTEESGQRDELRIDDIKVEAASFSSSEDEEVPESFRLKPNHPNPFNPETRITYELEKPTEVSVEIYAIDGGLIHRKNRGRQPSGLHSYLFDGSELSSGVYIYRVTAGNETQTRKMTMIR